MPLLSTHAGHAAVRLGSRAAFVPTDIANLVIWLDANQITGLANADPVGTWENRGSEADASAAGGGRPTYRTNVQNGLPVVDFDGLDDDMNIANAAELTWTAPWSVFVVAKTDSVAAGSPRIISKTSSAGLGRDADDMVFTTYGVLDYITAGVSWNTTDFFTMGYLFDDTDLDVDFRTNGAADETVAGTTNSTTGTAATYIGQRGDGTLRWDGPMAEIIVYKRMLTAAQITDLETYLKDKWATW